MELLKKVGEMLSEAGYRPGNIDAVIIAQKPKFRPYIDKMAENIAGVLKMDRTDVNIKATTEEGLGFTGNMQGIAAQAVCLIEEQGPVFSYR
jgi:2-C-methyl-D-erythritol 2,4-cyclodiphosphate synthase